jgi:hypothetical protein
MLIAWQMMSWRPEPRAGDEKMNACKISYKLKEHKMILPLHKALPRPLCYSYVKPVGPCDGFRAGNDVRVSLAK